MRIGKLPRMTPLDEYLRALRRRRRQLLRIERNPVGLALLRSWSDIRVCCSPAWHRPYWKYCGEGQFQCEVCERIAV